MTLPLSSAKPKLIESLVLQPDLTQNLLPFLTPKDTENVKRTLPAGRVWLVQDLRKPLENALKSYLNAPATEPNAPVPAYCLQGAALLASPGNCDDPYHAFLVSVANGQRGNAHDRRYAIQALGKVGNEQTIPCLKALATQASLSSDLRQEAQISWAKLDSGDKVFPAILPFFISGDQSSVTYNLFGILSSLKALKSGVKDPFVPAKIKEELLGTPFRGISFASPFEYQEFLFSVAKDSSQEVSVRNKAISSLHHSYLPSILSSQDFSESLKKYALSIRSLLPSNLSNTEQLGEYLLNMLLQIREERPQLSDRDMHYNYSKCMDTYRYPLVTILGRLRYEKANSHLINLLNDPLLTPYEQKIILESLGTIASSKSIPFLIERFKQCPSFASFQDIFPPPSSANFLAPAILLALDKIDVSSFPPDLLADYIHLLRSKVLVNGSPERYQYLAMDKLALLAPERSLHYLLLKLDMCRKSRDRDELFKTYKAIAKLNTPEALKKLEEMFCEKGLSSHEERTVILVLRDQASEASCQTLENIFNSIPDYSQILQMKLLALEALCKLKDMSPLLQSLALDNPSQHSFAFLCLPLCPTGADRLRAMIQNPQLPYETKKLAIKSLISSSGKKTFAEKALQNLIKLAEEPSLEREIQLEVVRGIAPFLKSLHKIADSEVELSIRKMPSYLLEKIPTLESDAEFKEACLQLAIDFLEHPSCRALSEKKMGICLRESFFSLKS